MTEYVKFEGDKKVIRKLEKLSKKDAAAAIRKASRLAMKPVLAKIKAKAPKLTGLLKKNLKLRALKGKGKKKRIGVAVGIPSGEPFRTARGDFYPATLIYGSKKRGIKPNNFMRDVFAEEAHPARDRAMKMILQEIKNQAKRK